MRRNWQGVDRLLVKAVCAGLTTVLVVGCGVRGPKVPEVSEEQDGPGPVAIGDQTPDAVPRVESLSRYGNPERYEVYGKQYRTLKSSSNYVERGVASWYGTKFHGRRTSSGEPYNMYAMTAAHKSLPLPTYVLVTNLDNGREAVVRVNDRGPFHEGRIIDLSYAAARKLGIAAQGTGQVEVRALDPKEYAAGSEAKVAFVPETALDATERYLQVGAFSSRTNAELLRDWLNANALDGVRIHEAKAQDHVVYRVQIGPLTSSDAIDQTTKRLEQLGTTDYVVVVD